jgi:hypothetical protein
VKILGVFLGASITSLFFSSLRFFLVRSRDGRSEGLFKEINHVGF